MAFLVCKRKSHLLDGDRAAMIGIMPKGHGLGDTQEMGQATHQNTDMENLMRGTEMSQLSRKEPLGSAGSVEHCTKDIRGAHADHVVQCDRLLSQGTLQVDRENRKKSWVVVRRGLCRRQGV